MKKKNAKKWTMQQAFKQWQRNTRLLQRNGIWTTLFWFTQPTEFEYVFSNLAVKSMIFIGSFIQLVDDSIKLFNIEKTHSYIKYNFFSICQPETHCWDSYEARKTFSFNLISYSKTFLFFFVCVKCHIGLQIYVFPQTFLAISHNKMTQTNTCFIIILWVYVLTWLSICDANELQSCKQ